MDRASLSQRSDVSHSGVLELFATTVHYWYILYFFFYSFPSVIAPAFSTPAVYSCIFSAPRTSTIKLNAATNQIMLFVTVDETFTTI